MRLTADLIHKSLSYINCLQERELDLRGHKITAIENLGAAQDNDAIDFTDNDIAQLGNFPLQPRLRTLFLAQNRIGAIQASLSSSIPNLTTLVLTKNRIAELADLDPLAGFKKLVSLTLLGNPVTNKEHYRHWVIFRCPSVRYLDFTRVRDAERSTATKLFGTAAEPTDLASQFLGQQASGFVVPSYANNSDAPAKTRIFTAEDRERLTQAIKAAGSLAEIERLEKDFGEGRVPPPILEGAGEAMET
ncbi:U2 small nuclear ribonucleoprotein A [Massariosphaeria phaeospora]|uniref:U2 small nuclear ribonucleoprotein A' n=1 Tax=Massariosphaeria phaeospora TaxID=100035 RepID=A0A7C8M8T5_9PLEO|nr:U2 small nuclear ribonucleoprotein A [Massariosphaeria phaeospora]